MRGRRRRVQGTVRWDDGGAPVANATVVLFASEDSRPLGSATTDKGGRYLAGLAPSTRWPATSVYAVVRGRDRRVLVSTRETPVVLRGRSAVFDIDADHTQRPSLRSALTRPGVRVGPVVLDADAVARAEPSIVLELARVLVNPVVIKPPTTKRIAALSPALLPANRPLQTCGEPVLQAIEALIAVRRWPRELFLEVEAVLSPASLGDVPSVEDCPNFTVTYYTTGPAAVDPDTSSQTVVEPGGSAVRTTLPAGPPPTYIKRLCYWLETALATYTSPPYSLANPAAAGKIPVEVTNTIRFGNATSTTFFINNALRRDMLAAVVVHEVFHRVQYEYAGLDGPGSWAGAMKEGGATWAEDTVTELINRYLYEAGNTTFSGGPGLLAMPHKSLESYDDRYKTSLFWRYVAEQHSSLTTATDEPTIGADTYRSLIEECAAGVWSADDIERALRTLPWYQDFYELGYLDPARLDLTNGETTWGNFALAGYLKDLGPNVPDRRFGYLENQENIYFDDLLNTFFQPPVPPQALLPPVTLAGSGTLTPAGSVTFNSSVPRFGTRYYAVTVGAGVTSASVQFTAGSTLSSRLFQIVLIDQDNRVREIYRTDRSPYVKQFANLRDGKRLDRIVLITSGAASDGMFSVTVSPAGVASDVMVTRWNSALRTEYEIDSRNWSWTWVSPDIWVDNNNDGVADDTVFFNVNNQLFVRLHNKGNAPATAIEVQFDYQDASGGLSPTGWFPVQNAAGITQFLTGLSLGAGTSNQWSVNWAPVPSGTSKHFCVRAVVTLPGDPNSDNKRALSNFGNVTVKRLGFADIRVLRRNLDSVRRCIEAAVVPRLSPDLRLSSFDLRVLQEGKFLEPGQAVSDVLRVSHRPARSSGLAAGHRHGDSHPQARRRPDPHGYYQADPRTLPPGVAGRPMVTIVHTVGGHPQGGVTILVKLAGRGDGRATSRREATPRGRRTRNDQRRRR